MKKLNLFLLLLLMNCVSIVQAQPPSDRYNAALFPNITETNGIQFSTAVPQPNEGGGFYEFITGLPLNVDEYDTSPVDLKMDIFEPQGDTLGKRPLVIICFGGGFLAGERTYWSIRLLCQELAKRGYVAVSIDYRLGMNIFDEDLSKRAVYRGVQDGRSAVRFFRADAAGANQYRIDPDQIFMGGHSAGAFIALHNAYLEKEIERPLSTYAWTQDGNSVADLGCLDCAGDNQSYSGHANAIFSLAGGVGDVNYIETTDDPKIVMFHSTDDSTVDYDSGEPFGSLLLLVVGSDLPVSYGSLPISNRCSAINLDYDFFSYTNREHEVHEDGNSDLYDDIIPGISDWFFEKELQPTYDTLLGTPIVCTGGLVQAYSLPVGEGYYFDWEIVGGTFLQMNAFSNEVLVQWDPLAIENSLEVIPYNTLDAKGETLTLDVIVGTSESNQFTAVSGNWEATGNWSQGRLPLPCDEITIPNTTTLVNMNSTAEINSLLVAPGSELIVAPASDLLVFQKIDNLSSMAAEIKGEVINQGQLSIHNITIGNEMLVDKTGRVFNFGELELGLR